MIAIESNVQGAAAGPTPIPRAGFSYARTLTIAPPLIATDLDSFPVLFAPGALSDLASSAHGGKVQSESGYDIVFTGDVGGTVLLNWEVENYDPATGTLVCWIQVPRLSRTSPTYIFMSYGNASATSLQSNATAVWDSNYAGVYHFSTGTGSTLSVNDSTANHNSGTSINGPVTLTSKLGGAVTFNNSNISLPTGNLPSGTSPTTLEGWFNIASLPPDMPQDSYLVSYGQPLHGEANGIFFEAFSGGFKTGWDSHAAAGPGQNDLYSNTVLQFNQWHHVATTYVCASPCNSPTGTVDVYVDGQLDNSNGPNQTGETDENTTNLIATLGTWMCSTNQGELYPCFSMTGSADEIRISKTNRSGDWIKAEYLNESNPATFVTVGAAVAAP